MADEEVRPMEYGRLAAWPSIIWADADDWRDEAWEIVRARPDLRWQILTKRPERMADHLPADWGEGWPHVWLGVSIENRRYVGRADALRETPAAVRFISAEPLLGPLMHDGLADGAVTIRGGPLHKPESERVVLGRWGYTAWADDYEGPELDLTGIDWLIVGGESGPEHRRMDPDWARDLRDAAQASGTAFFFKQDSGPRAGQRGRFTDEQAWPREMPELAA